MNNIRNLYLIFGMAVLLLIPAGACSQTVAVKNNLVCDAFGALSLGGEIALNPRASVGLYVSARPWERSDDFIHRHLYGEAEYRFWTCQKFNGSFFGVYLNGAQYNIGGMDLPFNVFSFLKNSRYEGWLAGGGISYGYDFMLSRHWSFETVIGLGYDHIYYIKYASPKKCAPEVGRGHYNYFGIGKLDVSLKYIF